MTGTTITSKGQITIPKHVRDALNLRGGDEVVITVEGERISLYPVRRRNILELHGVFAGRKPFAGRDAERTAAMQEAIRESLDLPESVE